MATLKVIVRAQPNLEDIVAPFSLLCSGLGLLVAAPTQSGGFAVWANAGKEIKVLCCIIDYCSGDSRNGWMLDYSFTT